MDLIPKPDQVVAAASNVAHKVLYGGLADLRPMPRTLIDEGTLREVYHYRPAAKVLESGDPVLLVTPLAAPALCFDLRRGCSLVEHFVGAGRPTYLVEYGEVSFRDRNLGMEHWVDEVVPTAVREVSAHAGGRPVHLVGWSLGGIFALLAAADDADLPVASVTVVGSPVDVSRVPLVAPLRPLLTLPLGWGTQGRGAITRAYQAMGGAPKPLVKWAFQLSSFQKLVTKPIALAQHLDDVDFLAQIEAVDRFTDHMIAYPGRTFGQLYHRFVKGNALVEGEMELGDRTIRLADVSVPVLVFGGRDRRHRADPRRQGGRATAQRVARGQVRGRARWPPRDADGPRRSRLDVDGDGRVARRVVDVRRGRAGRPTAPAAACGVAGHDRVEPEATLRLRRLPLPRPLTGHPVGGQGARSASDEPRNLGWVRRRRPGPPRPDGARQRHARRRVPALREALLVAFLDRLSRPVRSEP